MRGAAAGAVAEDGGVTKMPAAPELLNVRPFTVTPLAFTTRPSAAAPWIGAFIAARSANCRSATDLEAIIGMLTLRPKRVVTNPWRRTSARVASM